MECKYTMEDQNVFLKSLSSDHSNKQESSAKTMWSVCCMATKVKMNGTFFENVGGQNFFWSI